MFASVIALILATSIPARAPPNLIDLVNQDRHRYGLHALTESSYLDSVAQRHTHAMARAGTIFHTSDAALYRLCCWKTIGENVGKGPVDASDSPEPATIERSFMESDEHRPNILDPTFTQIGVGMVPRGSTLYVTELFWWGSHFTRPLPRAPPREEPQTVQMLLRIIALWS